MPIYEYLCEKCRRTTEVIQSFRDKPLLICPHCGSKKIHKLVSAPAIQFKGSGWYVTDYANKSKPPGEAPVEPKKKDEPKETGKSAQKENGPKKKKG